MLSINPCCEDSFRGVFEYCSSTGRVRSTQAVVGSIARNTVRARMGRLLLMQTYQSSTLFEYIVPERSQKLGRTLSGVYELGSGGRPRPQELQRSLRIAIRITACLQACLRDPQRD